MTSRRSVTIDGRRFFVVSDSSGNPRIIYERLTHAPGKPWQAEYNRTRWHADHHPIPCRTNSIYRRVIDAITGANP